MIMQGSIQNNLDDGSQMSELRLDIPPPPPPPAPATTALRTIKTDSNVSNSKIETQSPAFVILGNTSQDIEYIFRRDLVKDRNLSLRTLIGHYLRTPQSSNWTAKELDQILGRLRCLHYAIQNYNSGLSTNTPVFLQYWQPHTLNLLSGFGFHPGSDQTPIFIEGLE